VISPAYLREERLLLSIGLIAVMVLTVELVAVWEAVLGPSAFGSFRQAAELTGIDIIVPAAMRSRHSTETGFAAPQASTMKSKTRP
jgi:hypothetical protein